LVIVIAALSSSGRRASPAPASKTSTPAAEDPRETSARAALERARAVERSQLRLVALDDVVWKHPDSAAARVAAAERDRLRAELDERMRAAARDLDAKVAALLAREDFAEALRAVDAAAAGVEAPRWPDEILRRSRDIRERAERLYEELRAKAGDADALRVAAARVRSWGLKPLIERIERELPPEVPPETRAYRIRWEAAAARASSGDFGGALADLRAAGLDLKDPALRSEAARDLEDFAALSLLRPKLRSPPGRLLPGRFLSLRVWPPAGPPRMIEGLLDQADAFRARLRTGPGPVSVEWSDVAIGDRAALFKPKEDARLVALLCLLDAEPVAARRFAADTSSIAEKYWAWGESGKGRPKPPSPEEIEARGLLFAADRDYPLPERLPEAVEKYRTLRDRLGSTPAARSAAERIARRADAGKDYVFGGAELRGDGAARRDGELAWTLSKDAPGAVELAFAALPGATYRGWVHARSCCADALAIQVQGTDLPARPLPHSKGDLPAGHAPHAARPVSRWDWIPLPLPGGSGVRRLRLSSSKAGFGISAVAVSASRTAPPSAEELKEALKRRAADAPEVFLSEGLVARWAFDEGSGAEAKDASGQGNRAVLKGATWTPDGLLGGALRVDGSGAHAEAPNTESLENVQERSFTLAAWFLAEDLPPGRAPANDARYGILHKPGHHLGPSFDHSGKFAAEFWADGGKGHGVASERTYAPGAWHHVAQVVNLEAGTLEIFVDGEWQGYLDIPRGAACVEYESRPFRIGIANPGGTAYAWPAKGSIDDARIYSRPLGVEEVRALYRLGR
jgi:hypothetical protein